MRAANVVKYSRLHLEMNKALLPDIGQLPEVDIDDLAGEEEELANLVERLDKASTAYGMEISAEKTKRRSYRGKRS